jgi:hypothetical protein
MSFLLHLKPTNPKGYLRFTHGNRFLEPHTHQTIDLHTSFTTE